MKLSFPGLDIESDDCIEIKIENVDFSGTKKQGKITAKINWNPIDTAPKDGTDILGMCDEYMVVCHWCNYIDDGTSWCPQVFSQNYGWNDFQGELHEITHWMPLPTPPEE